MSHRKHGKESNEELREQIRQLREKLGGVSAGASAGGESGQAEGLAQGIVSALGRLVPGLGKLIESASQSPEFHTRLRDIDEEVQRRFQEQPLRQAAAGLAAAAPRRQMGIPPSVRRAASARPGAAGGGRGASPGKSAPRGKYPQPRPPKVHISPETPAQFPVDVFDEGSRLVVLADAPGLQVADLAVSLDGSVLVIAIEAPHRKGVQRVELPCEPAGEPEVSLANGILQIHVRKAARS
jgi:hypothetical protein